MIFGDRSEGKDGARAQTIASGWPGTHAAEPNASSRVTP